MGLDGLQTGIGGVVGKIKSIVTKNPFGSAVVGTAVVGTGALVVAKVAKSRKKTKKKTKAKPRKKATKKKPTGRKLKFGSPAWRKKYIKKGKKRKPKYARTAGKGKDTSTRRIRMTKNGQPYVILASGKARFIKKSSAKRSRKLKGGRY